MSRNADIMFQTALSGNLTKIRVLLEQGHSVNSSNSDGMHLLTAALYLDDDCARMKLVKYLIRRGADVTYADPVTGRHAVLWAAYLNLPAKLLRVLLKSFTLPQMRIASIHKKDKANRTALHYAVMHSNGASLTLLCEILIASHRLDGSHLELTMLLLSDNDKNRCTPLMLARTLGRKQCARIIQSYSAEYNYPGLDDVSSQSFLGALHPLYISTSTVNDLSTDRSSMTETDSQEDARLYDCPIFVSSKKYTLLNYCEFSQTSPRLLFSDCNPKKFASSKCAVVNKLSKTENVQSNNCSLGNSLVNKLDRSELFRHSTNEQAIVLRNSANYEHKNNRVCNSYYVNNDANGQCAKTIQRCSIDERVRRHSLRKLNNFSIAEKLNTSNRLRAFDRNLDFEPSTRQYTDFEYGTRQLCHTQTQAITDLMQILSVQQCDTYRPVARRPTVKVKLPPIMRVAGVRGVMAAVKRFRKPCSVKPVACQK